MKASLGPVFISRYLSAVKTTLFVSRLCSFFSRLWRGTQSQPESCGFALSRLQWLSGAVLFVGSCVFHLLSYGLVDDHFDRIARGRQIVQYGEWPFKDFFDPGYFLTLFASATAQFLFGDNLLGEALLNVVCLSIGFTLTFVVLIRTMQSLPLAAVVTLLVMVSGPRFYDYDKVLFYPLGVFLCWRYIDRMSSQNLIALGLATALAFWFRYDNGIFIAGAAVVALFVMHFRSRTFARRLVLYAGVVVLASLPSLAFLQVNGGILDYVHQIATYASREGERTRWFSQQSLTIDASAPLVSIEPPAGYRITVRWVEGLEEVSRLRLERRFLLEDADFRGERTWSYTINDDSTEYLRSIVTEPLVEDTGSIDRSTFRIVQAGTTMDRVRRIVPFLRMELLPGVLSRENLLVFLYYLFIAVPFAAVLVLWRNIFRSGALRGQEPEVARVLSLAVMCLLVDGFILRAPLAARIGAVAPPIAILGSWLVVNARLRDQARHVANLSIMGFGEASPWMLRAQQGGKTVVMVVVAVAFVGFSALSVREKFQGGRIAERVAALAVSPPAETLLPNGRDLGLVRYVRQCSAPTDRVLVTWFMPHLYSYSGRGFAGGMVVFFGHHWSGERFQRRTVNRLRQQSVPIVIVELASYERFQEDYALVDAYIQAHYRTAGESHFGNPDAPQDAYRVMVRAGLTPTGVDDSSKLPCFG